MAAAWAAPPASSPPFPHPGSSLLSPSSVTSLRGILSPAAGLAHLGLLSGAPEEAVGSSHRLDSFQAYRKVTECPRVLPNAHCPASAANMLLYRMCTRSAGHLASLSGDTLRFSHGAPSVFEAQPLYLGTVTATPKEPLLFAVQTALARLP